MPELPEVMCRACEMKSELVDRSIASIEVRQPKCLNVAVETFKRELVGATIREVTSRGKWLFVETSQGHLLINSGMGGEILLVPRDKVPETWRVRFDFADGDTLSVNFWWFGNAHYVPSDGLADHRMTAALGPNALGLSLEQLRSLLDGRRGRIKSFLLDQKKIAGIGNAYSHDILFRAKLHPQRPIPTLSGEEVARLHKAIQTELQRSVDVGGAFYEVNLYGTPGGFTAEDLLVGYREGKPCPDCGATIERIRVGSTSSFVCPACQPIGR